MGIILISMGIYDTKYKLRTYSGIQTTYWEPLLYKTIFSWDQTVKICRLEVSKLSSLLAELSFVTPLTDYTAHALSGTP
jgi:hypothetical protein